MSYRTLADIPDYEVREVKKMDDKEFWLMQWKRGLLALLAISAMLEVGYFINNKLEWQAKITVSQNELEISKNKLAEAWSLERITGLHK